MTTLVVVATGCSGQALYVPSIHAQSKAKKLGTSLGSGVFEHGERVSRAPQPGDREPVSRILQPRDLRVVACDLRRGEIVVSHDLERGTFDFSGTDWSWDGETFRYWKLYGDEPTCKPEVLNGIAAGANEGHTKKVVREGLNEWQVLEAGRVLCKFDVSKMKGRQGTWSIGETGCAVLIVFEDYAQVWYKGWSKAKAWRRGIGGNTEFWGGVVVHGDSVFVAWGGELLEMSVLDGAVLRTLRIPEQRSDLTVGLEQICVVVADRDILVVDREDWEVVDRQQSAGSIVWSSMGIIGSTLVFLESGSQPWE